MLPTIYVFFASLVARSGYFATSATLRDVVFPSDLVVAESRGGFPDIVLKASKGAQGATGGEMVELKDAKSMSIPSFNSSIPSATKGVDDLPIGLLRRLEELGELDERLTERDVYYLIRGRDLKSRPAPKTKVILVNGAFFETVPTDQLLLGAFDQVAHDATGRTASLPPDIFEAFKRQEHFARVRHVEGASVKIRFRVMTEAETETNLMNPRQFPQFPDDTLSMLVPFHSRGESGESNRPFDWPDPPDEVADTDEYHAIDAAISDAVTGWRDSASGFVLRHPLNGPFFVIQLPLNWSTS